MTGLDDQQFDDQGLGILPSLSTHHGFTGHEMLDDMTLVHMNGRLYDPIIARFISADPHIDGLYSPEGLNSYSYVHNNPLSATDPSGYFLKKLVKKIVGGVKKAVKSVFKAVMKPVGKVISAMGPLAQPLVAIGSIFAFQGMAPQCYAAVMGAGSFAAANANGASFNQSLRIGALAGATAYVGAHAAHWIGSNANSAIANVGMHGVRGGVTTLVSGGDFRSGFLAGSFGAFGDVNDLTNSHFGAGLFGGIGAKLGGGDFAEGAVVAIVGHEFNDRRHRAQKVRQQRLANQNSSSKELGGLILEHAGKLNVSAETGAAFGGFGGNLSASTELNGNIQTVRGAHASGFGAFGGLLLEGNPINIGNLSGFNQSAGLQLGVGFVATKVQVMWGPKGFRLTTGLGVGFGAKINYVDSGYSKDF